MTTLALVIYAIVIAAAVVVVWSRPVVAFYAFLVGLAFHNIVMDALYAGGIHGGALTAIQAWKDILLLVALARVATDASRARRLPFTPTLADAFALAFALLVVVYALIPQSALDGHATHKAIAYALRHDLTGVGAYFLGRAVIVRVRDIRWILLVLAAALAAWGLVDVYAIHLSWWRHNGTVGYFHNQLGFDYGKGLSGLPENFVYNTGNELDLLRRLVSTFLSPLATAYLCVVALLVAPRTRAAIPFAALAWRRDSSGRTPAPRCSRSRSASSSSPRSHDACGRSPRQLRRSSPESRSFWPTRTSARRHGSPRPNWSSSARTRTARRNPRTGTQRAQANRRRSRT